MEAAAEEAEERAREKSAGPSTPTEPCTLAGPCTPVGVPQHKDEGTTEIKH